MTIHATFAKELARLQNRDDRFLALFGHDGQLAWREKHEAKASPPAITRRISPDPDNADAALLLLGIAAPNPARAEFGEDRAQLLLEPWAVQAALHRRRGGQRLTDDERDWIRRRTRDPDSLRWPRGTKE